MPRLPCQRLKAEDMPPVSENGLGPGSYFSGTKIAWMLANRPGLREKAERGDICFGTVDSWLIWCLTGGERHVTDYTNASRTLLYNIFQLEWDRELLEILDIPAGVLPEVLPSCGLFGVTKGLNCLPDGIPFALGGPAGGFVRSVLLPAGDGQEHLRHWLFRTDEHRQ